MHKEDCNHPCTVSLIYVSMREDCSKGKEYPLRSPWALLRITVIAEFVKRILDYRNWKEIIKLVSWDNWCALPALHTCQIALPWSSNLMLLASKGHFFLKLEFLNNDVRINGWQEWHNDNILVARINTDEWKSLHLKYSILHCEKILFFILANSKNPWLPHMIQSKSTKEGKEDYETNGCESCLKFHPFQHMAQAYLRKT